MDDIRYEAAWQRRDPRHAADAKVFWAAEQLVDPGDMDARTNDLCSVAYADGKIVGLSTVHINVYPPLRSRFAFYRCAVATPYRRRDLAVMLTRHTIITMEGWAHEHAYGQVQGVATLLQARELDEKARNPVWAEYYGNLNLAGFTERGDQVRVAWFRHARLESPPA